MFAGNVNSGRLKLDEFGSWEKKNGSWLFPKKLACWPGTTEPSAIT